MASTWSALKVELLETGANAGSWGTLTNANLGDAVLGEAITGQATVDFSSDADVTITLTDSASTQAARNLRLNITESSTGIGSVRNLILGSGCQIEKFYLINNTGTGAKTVKNTSGTGISVPAGKATLVYNNGTNVVDAASYFTSLTLGSALPVASGGTGITSFGSGVATFLGTPSSANLAAALTDETGTGSAVFATSPTLVTPNLGTPSTLVLSSATGLPLTSGVTGILPVANGGTATATPSLVQGTGVTISGTWPNQTINATGTGGTVTSVGGTGTVNGLTLTGTVTTSGSLTLGGTLSLVSPPAIGSTSPNTGAFTTLSATSTITSTNYGTFKGLRIGLDGGNDIYNSSAANTYYSTSGNSYAHSFGNASASTYCQLSYTTQIFYSSNVERARVQTGFSVGTTADPGAGAIYATGNITAYYSDDRLKTRLGVIENALDKVDQLQGFYYEANETAQALGYKVKREVGVSAQSVQAVLPEIVSPAPIDQQYLTVDYERLVPLLIEAVKELRAEVKALKGE